ncbi:MAG: hypothetical protein ACM3SU_00505 [Acidobacteriota bacterium]
MSLRWRVFLWGFGLSVPLLILEYVSDGQLPGWLILLPTNPTTLAAAVIARDAESLSGPRWSSEAFFGTFILESAFWWYLVAGVTDVIRRHRATGPGSAVARVEPRHGTRRAPAPSAALSAPAPAPRA